jgi:hypothetical protein
MRLGSGSMENSLTFEIDIVMEEEYLWKKLKLLEG